MDASKSVPEFNTISRKSNKTYPYLDESRGLSPLSNIPDPVGDKQHYEEDNATSEDIQLKKETKEESRLQLNRGDRDSDIQLSDATLKKSRQDRLAKSTPGTRQSAYIKNKTPSSANVIHLISASLLVLKSHIYIVTVLANLNTGCNDSDPDEPLFLIGRTLRRLCIQSFNLL